MAIEKSFYQLKTLQNNTNKKAQLKNIPQLPPASAGGKQIIQTRALAKSLNFKNLFDPQAKASGN